MGHNHPSKNGTFIISKSLKQVRTKVRSILCCVDAVSAPGRWPRLNTFLGDVRTERAVRMAFVYAASIAVFYYWTVPAIYRNGVFGVSPLLYWAPLLGVAGLPVVMQYSTGAFWQFGLLQILALPVILTMMTLTLIAMKVGPMAAWLLHACTRAHACMHAAMHAQVP